MQKSENPLMDIVKIKEIIRNADVNVFKGTTCFKKLSPQEKLRWLSWSAQFYYKYAKKKSFQRNIVK